MPNLRQQKPPQTSNLRGKGNNMKGFIAIELLRDGKPTAMLVSVSNIKYVEKNKNGKADIAFNCVGTHKKRPVGWSALCVQTVETYSEVLAKIAAALE